MRYNQLKEFFLNKGYFNNDDYPCVFIRKSLTGFCIILVYVDGLNIIGTELDINKARDHLKTEFEMKDLCKTKFCLGLQLEHIHTGFSYINRLMSKKYLRNSVWIKSTRLKLLWS
jgi:hypothetical protein